MALLTGYAEVQLVNLGMRDGRPQQVREGMGQPHAIDPGNITRSLCGLLIRYRSSAAWPPPIGVPCVACTALIAAAGSRVEAEPLERGREQPPVAVEPHG